ncbi:hypothetical protein V1514DRAFT_336039 [Lipomyces japonicus]|uniref:uncharacterized protein n=1 Tax=Lipomyces japonicus TaxID=56871 RepID=UPI0034CD5304
MELFELLAALQFPDSTLEDEDYRLRLLQESVRQLVIQPLGLNVAAISRMLVLSPAIWRTAATTGATKSENIPSATTVASAFSSVVQQKLQLLQPNKNDYNENASGVKSFINAVVAGISSCADVPDRQVAALAGLLSGSPIASMTECETAFVVAFNSVRYVRPLSPDDNDDDGNNAALVVNGFAGFSHLRPLAKKQLRGSPQLLELFSRVLFAPDPVRPGQKLVSQSLGPLSQFTGHLFMITTSSQGVQASLPALDVIANAVTMLKGRHDSKQFAFSTVAVLSGLIDSLLADNDRAGNFNFLGLHSQKTTLHHRSGIAIKILLVLRDLAPAIYNVSLSGFTAEDYVHSAATGVLVSAASSDFSPMQPQPDQQYLLEFIDALFNVTDHSEMLFALNTAEKLLLALGTTGAAACPLGPGVLAKLISPAIRIVESDSTLQQQQEHVQQVPTQKLKVAILEASHAVFLASLNVTCLAGPNAEFVRRSYLARVIGLYKSGAISDQQFEAAARAVAIAVAPGASGGLLSACDPGLAEDIVLPAIKRVVTRGDNYIHNNNESRKAILVGVFVDVVLKCSVPDHIPYWLDEVGAGAGSHVGSVERQVVAERIRQGEIPTECADSVIRWWYDHQITNYNTNNSAKEFRSFL